ncbi:MAG: lasso peptide [Brasilonema octagenarum HA4186-MV1]|jgi:hypothetical protein|uniref:RiPP n=1 Tax=Brasilonema octagenarum UFV-OR1 TaxID=417115 RepID=A0ABX1M143_9CYAN|nr:lasso peptide [Brasilonema octagenarum]MBW4630292.1 lasso peptide [Brasilonema octagenarum HA4186-MV1]NMF62208.1 putative RiPP precursor [Brasilonema octagenarum UFV-OR1]
MKKTYEAPRLTNHGNVSEITAFSFDSSKKDTYFGPPMASTPLLSGTGSLDGCVKDSSGKCI